MFRVRSRNRKSSESSWSGGVVTNRVTRPFSRRYSSFITRFSWLIIALWLVFTAASVYFLPKLDTVVTHMQINYLPTDSPVVEGQNLLNEIGSTGISQSSAVIAFHHPKGLNSAAKGYIQNKLADILANQGQYGVNQVQDIYHTDKRFASSFLSRDGTTEIAFVGFPQNEVSNETASAIQRLRSAFTHPPADLKVYLTGDAPLEQDNIRVLQHGVQRMAVVTIAFVLFILILTFRSLITPLLTLLAVGLSFLITSGLVAWLAVRGLPTSGFTQTFLIAVLFGAGTDYSIILLSRFKEELVRQHGDKTLALSETLRATSKSIIFSASTVVASFSVLYFARFGLYRSAVGVGIGVVLLVLSSLTLIPALMSQFGRWVFWPLSLKPGAEHRPSNIWSRTSGIAVRHPWWTLLVTFLILTPIALLFTDKRTFDPMDDIPSASSVQGFRTVSQAFGPGRMMPMEIVLHSSKNLRSPEGLTTIEHVSRAIASLSQVAQVDSATRLTGSVIPEFQIANQNLVAAQGLDQVQQNLSQLQTHLRGAQVSQNTMSTLQNLQTLSSALQRSSQGTAQLVQGLNQSISIVDQLAAGTSGLSLSGQQLAQNATELVNAIAQWAKANPSTTGSPAWNQIVQLANSQQQGARQLTNYAQQAQRDAGQIHSTMMNMTQGSSQVDQNLRQAMHGTVKLVQTGGIQTLSSQLSRLLPGLNQAASGVGQLRGGVGDISDYLVGSSTALTQGDPGFYVPPSALTSNPGFRKLMNAYISPDGHVAKLTVVLKTNPYSSAAIQGVPVIEYAANVALLASPLHDGHIYAVGTTPLQAELNNISSQDFGRTVVLVLSSIFVLLILMLRSILTPFYIVLSLSGTYFITMGLLQTITTHILHKPGLAWPVPFFVFLLLVALGVDYSIFLMSRFEEEMIQGVTPKHAIQTAMANMGKVIFPAVVIMAGTFGSMSVAGVSSLIEMAIAVIIGLILYFTVMLGFFVPACAAVLGSGHFWPFVGNRRLVRLQ